MEMLDRAEQLNEEVATPNLPNEELPGETPEDAECASEENVTRESLLKTIEMIVAEIRRLSPMTLPESSNSSIHSTMS